MTTITTYTINKNDVLYKHPHIFRHLVWNDGIATINVMKVTGHTFTTTQHYIDKKTSEVNFLEVPANICHKV
jgi:integrase